MPTLPPVRLKTNSPYLLVFDDSFVKSYEPHNGECDLIACASRGYTKCDITFRLTMKNWAEMNPISASQSEQKLVALELKAGERPL
jgi:hypothetical protein